MSYGVFAQYYDRLTQNVDYNAYAKRLDELIPSDDHKRRLLVDLGCGTGSLTLAMEKYVYEVIGIDLSCDMLSVAFNKKLEADSNAMFVNQDITRFSLPRKADVIICSLDVLNHLPNKDAVERVFRTVEKYLAEDGLFIFDMNTPYKHKYLMSDNAFIYDLGDVYVTWQNEYNAEDGSVDIALDFFIEDESGLYDRYTEEFTEQVYEQEEVLDMIIACGLKPIGCYDSFTDKEVHDKSDRILYVAKRG